MKRFCITYYPITYGITPHEIHLSIAKLKQDGCDIPIYAVIVEARDYEDAMRRFLIDNSIVALRTGIRKELNIEITEITETGHGQNERIRHHAENRL